MMKDNNKTYDGNLEMLVLESEHKTVCNMDDKRICGQWCFNDVMNI